MFLFCSYRLGVQYSLPLLAMSPIAEINDRLLPSYGPLPTWRHLDPVSQLILAVLGEKTRNEVSMRVFEDLALRFHPWQRLLAVRPAEIRPLIEPVTFAEKKAVWIPKALRAIHAYRGVLELDFLRTWPVESARAWLERLPGVGPKVSAAIVNFSRLRMRALVVDSHHLRVAKRLGLVSAKASLAKAAGLLMGQMPDGWGADDLDDHHTLMKWHGQRVCRDRSPDCRCCPLRDLCPSGRGEADSLRR